MRHKRLQNEEKGPKNAKFSPRIERKILKLSPVTFGERSEPKFFDFFAIFHHFPRI